MVWHVQARAREAGCFDRVLVATDDDRVVDALVPLGVDVVRTGPAPNGTARVAAIAPPDVAVVNVQGDQPLVDPAHLRLLAGACRGDHVVTLCAPLEGDPAAPARVKVAPSLDDFSRRPFPGAAPRIHVGLYAFGPGLVHRCAAAPPSVRSRAEDLEQLAWIDAGVPVRAIPVANATPSVDTPDDLLHLRAILASR